MFFQKQINKHAMKKIRKMLKKLGEKHSRLDSIARLISAQHGFLACASVFEQMEEIQNEIRYFNELMFDIENHNITIHIQIKKNFPRLHLYYVFRTVE